MTVRAPMIGTDTDSAETFRLALGGLLVPASVLNARTGVTSTPVLTGTGNFTATVSAFTAVVDGTSNSLQGSYPVAVDAAATVTIGAANTQPRIDLISLQIQDNAYDGSGFSRGQLVVTAGTPAGSPVAPATPANALPLWTVPVAANATSVVFSSATAVFPYTATAGGIVPARNAGDKPAVLNGAAYRHRLDVTATAGGTSPVESSTDGVTWSPVFDASVVPATTAAAIAAATATLGTWNSYSPSTSIAVNNGTISGSYTKIGKACTARVAFQWGSTTTLSGAMTFGLPFTAATFSGGGGIGWVGSVFCFSAASNNRAGVVYIGSGGTLMVADSDNLFSSWSGTVPQTWANGDQFVAEVTYQTV